IGEHHVESDQRIDVCMRQPPAIFRGQCDVDAKAFQLEQASVDECDGVLIFDHQRGFTHQSPVSVASRTSQELRPSLIKTIQTLRRQRYESVMTKKERTGPFMP